MLVKDFITKEIPVLKSFDTGEYALALMDDNKVKHLPLLEDNTSYRGIVSERELLSCLDLARPLSDLNFIGSDLIRPGAHLLEALSLMARNRLTVLPVVSEDNDYIGSVTQEGLVGAMSDFCQADVAGSIIILEILPVDYSVVDIAHLVESNHAHITGLFTQMESTTGRLLVTLKIDQEDASAIIRTFVRFNYVVLWHFMKNGVVDDIFQQRMNELIHYLNI